MYDVLVFKAAHDLQNRVHLADVREELVAQAFALARAAHETSDVHQFDGGGGELFGVIDVGQVVQPRIRDAHHAHIGLDGAEGVIFTRSACARDCVEKRALSDIGQADDAKFHSGSPFINGFFGRSACGGAPGNRLWWGKTPCAAWPNDTRPRGNFDCSTRARFSQAETVRELRGGGAMRGQVGLQAFPCCCGKGRGRPASCEFLPREIAICRGCAIITKAAGMGREK